MSAVPGADMLKETVIGCVMFVKDQTPPVGPDIRAAPLARLVPLLRLAPVPPAARKVREAPEWWRPEHSIR